MDNSNRIRQEQLNNIKLRNQTKMIDAQYEQAEGKQQCL